MEDFEIEETHTDDYKVDSRYREVYEEIKTFINSNYVDKDNINFRNTQSKIDVMIFNYFNGSINKGICSIEYNKRENDNYIFSLMKQENDEFLLSVYASDYNLLHEAMFIKNSFEYKDQDGTIKNKIEFVKVREGK